MAVRHRMYFPGDLCALREKTPCNGVHNSYSCFQEGLKWRFFFCRNTSFLLYAWLKKLFYQSLCLLYFLSLRGKKKSSQRVGQSVMVYLQFPTQRRGYFFKGSAQPQEQRGHEHWAPFPPPIHRFISWLIEWTVAWTLYSVLNLRMNKNIKFLSSVPALSQLSTSLGGIGETQVYFWLVKQVILSNFKFVDPRD